MNVSPVPSIFRRFYRKDPGPSQAPEEPPLPASTTKEPPQIRKTGTVNTEDLLQLSGVVDYPVYFM